MNDLEVSHKYLILDFIPCVFLPVLTLPLKIHNIDLINVLVSVFYRL